MAPISHLRVMTVLRANNKVKHFDSINRLVETPRFLLSFLTAMAAHTDQVSVRGNKIRFGG
jgi:hypothetical protein